MDSIAKDCQDTPKKDEKDGMNAAATTFTFSSSCGRFSLNGDQSYVVRVLKMKDSTLVFIGELGSESLDEMAMAMAMCSQTREQGKDERKEETGEEQGRKEEILSTTLFGGQNHSPSQLLAEKLSRRYRRQFFVSFNVKPDTMIEPLLEAKLAEYIKTHIEQFT